jgi:hypothetical protein
MLGPALVCLSIVCTVCEVVLSVTLFAWNLLQALPETGPAAAVVVDDTTGFPPWLCVCAAGTRCSR